MGDAAVVLVVEDESLVREHIANVFREAGWEVLETSSAERAIELLRAAGNRIHVVFTDIQLAGHLDGWDVADAFRGHHAEAPVVYTSGNSADRSRRVAGSLFFNKPYDTSMIVRSCRKLADGFVR